MKKLRYILLTILFLSINIIYSFNVYALEKYSMSFDSPSTVTKGSNITLTFYAKNLTTIKNGLSGYSGTISYDSSKLEFVSISNSISGWYIGKSNPTNKLTFLGYDDSPPDNTKKSDTEIFKVVFKATSEYIGSTKIEVSNIKGSTSVGESLNADPITKTITITEPEAKKSSDASLSSLSVTGHTITPSFNSTTTSYSITVPNNIKTIDINAISKDKNAKVTISGNKNLSVGKNNVIVEVEAEDGTKKLYKIEVTRKSSNSSSEPQTQEKSSDNNLESISGIPNLKFDSNLTEYEVIIPFETTSINVSAKASDPKAKVSISNSNLKDLEVDKTNTITITVTAEDSSVKIYTINIKRSQKESETDLKELIVNNENLLKQDGENNKYKITVPNNVNKLDISAVPSNDGSTVKITGNDNLKDGTNTVVIEVTDKNGFTKSYTIEVEKEKGNVFTSFLKNYWLLLIAILLTILIIFLMIYFNRKNKRLIDEFNEKNNKDHTGINVIEYTPTPPNDIDNNDVILYNSNSNIVEDTYVPKHFDEDGIVNDGMVQNILNDESVSEVKKEMKVVKSEKIGEEEVEKEYTITEKYRKK